MKNLSDICINVNKTSDNFVGIKYNKGDIKIIFPLGYEVPNNEKECRISILQLLKTITLIKEKKFELEYYGDYSIDSNGLPIDSYIWILSDYISNGIYSNIEKVYKQDKIGKINWKKTFKTNFFVSKKSLIYLNPIVEKKTDVSNILTKIHLFCIDKSIDIIGPIYNVTHKLSNNNFNKAKIKYFIQLVEKELLNTFDDRKKLMLFHMKKILKEQIDNGNNPIRNFGTHHYEHVWEYMVNSVFGDENINKYYPTTEYNIIKKDKYIPSKLRPDTIFTYEKNFYILDSKYYKFGVTFQNKDLPNSDSIQKQVTYGEFINNNFNLDKKYHHIYNSFIIPYSKLNNKFNQNDNIIYVGYAKCNWKLKNYYKENYLKISIILIDTKYLINCFFKKDNKIKNELINKIENIDL